MTISVCNPVRIAAGVLVWLALSATTAQAGSGEGLFVTVPNPITSDALERIQKQVSSRLHDVNEDRRIRTVVFDFNPDGKPAATAKPGVCSDLAAFIRSLRGSVTTVAFVHNKVSGHTVLPVLAAQELIMSKGASIGEIVADGVEPERGEYALNFGKDPLYVVIRKMADREVKLVRGRNRTTQAAQFADARNEAEVKQQLAGVEPVPGVPDGQLGLYDAATAKLLGLSKGTAESRKEIAELYGLPPPAIRDDPLAGRSPDVFRWTLSKDVDEAMRESLNRVIRDVRKKGGNVLILEINSGGSDLVAARRIADDLRAAQTGDDPLQIIAFIADTAPGAGTIIALGSSDIVMYRPNTDTADLRESEIGDFSDYLKGAKPSDADANLTSIRELAESQGYPGVLIDGMFKKDLEIVRVTGKNDKRLRRLMTREEFERNRAEWNEDKTIKPKGQLLKLNATTAADLGLARFIVVGKDVGAVTAVYGYKEAKDPDPGWLDRFADFLRLPVVTVLLVVLGFTGLILELKVPGLTVPGIIAALCFILVFWAHSRFSGQTFVLALLLFLLGLVLVGMEIFVLPGFGACGIFGIFCMLGGLGLVTLEKVPDTAAEWGDLGVRITRYMIALMGAMLLAIFIARFLPRLPGANRLVLEAPNESASDAAEALPGGSEAAELLGAIGTTSTPMRPAGVVKFGEKFVDVVSDGGFIPAGTRVQVIQVEGTRIVVKEV